MITALIAVPILIVLTYTFTQGPAYECQPLGDPAFICGYWQNVYYTLGFYLLALTFALIYALPALALLTLIALIIKRLAKK